MPDTNQSGTAELIIDGRSYQLPIIEGMEGDRAIDIRGLLKNTGYTVFDTGYKNSASCSSTITYLDGNKGLLLYRGYAIEDLAARCLFIEVAYLLLHNKLPNREELESFRTLLEQHALIHEDMIHFFDKFPPNASPMSFLSVLVYSLHKL